MSIESYILIGGWFISAPAAAAWTAEQIVKHALTSAAKSWQCLDFALVSALNYAVIIQVKNSHWHPHTQAEAEGGVCLSW